MKDVVTDVFFNRAGTDGGLLDLASVQKSRKTKKHTASRKTHSTNGVNIESRVTYNVV